MTLEAIFICSNVLLGNFTDVACQWNKSFTERVQQLSDFSDFTLKHDDIYRVHLMQLVR